MVALIVNHEPGFSALIDSGIDLNMQDKQGRTALMFAAQSDVMPFVNQLKQKGADILMKNNDGYRASVYIKDDAKNKDAMEKALTPPVEEVSVKEEPVIVAAKTNASRNSQQDAAVLKAGEQVLDMDKSTAELVNAIINGAPIEKITALLEKSDINAQNDKGQTALMFAAKEGNVKLVELLYDKGADISITDKEGLKAINYAYLGESEEAWTFLQGKGLFGSSISKQQDESTKNSEKESSFSFTYTGLAAAYWKYCKKSLGAIFGGYFTVDRIKSHAQWATGQYSSSETQPKTDPAADDKASTPDTQKAATNSDGTNATSGNHALNKFEKPNLNQETQFLALNGKGHDHIG